MATLDSPLEVLAFDYVNFVFNNLWTWIAVVTAAVSFWRIRATTTSGGGGRDDGFIDESPREPPKPQATKAALVVETKPPSVKVTETEDWSLLLCNDGVTKGKLTVYYEEMIDGEREEDDGETTVVKYGGGASGEWWERWERVVKMRNGDEGWYRYVDLTVINGNVVRLWDANGVRNGGWVSVQRKECYG
ncbi:unnamed protein product [Arabidopsis lyrata]|uniref:Plant invertase/pectin methylesterase inhibitor superfamily protein n=1 Tax=Arabidopsis lyrata subsp. lyrata TaxID=81972 RepID=D7LPF5_ARALL|nr:uncharacterized protein LOC9313335 [Arabidopsis lyrata subsp. lyrata]EFH53526.1 hypothetical protein ARALYDRAFT_905411 [Arabidopsis lyrata subsp. lyrata]CAH8267283.1 unnamed protein product [Arabidopsis lyrata]|eukprot:XP_002877267.1 uncharacterized protein LOC9313335 [Arabidopsis lyrata subsp. lyrata]